ncbi:MAG: tetratricopeptide repeat protein [Acidobacteriota bacterium]
MLRLDRLICCLVLGIFGLPAAGIAQQQTPPKKPPGLVRDTGVAEGKTDAETAAKKNYSPMLAEENLKIGDSYFKKGNYDAAISRYRDAIEYQPNLVQAYDRLGRAYEKKGDKAKALAVYKDFLNKYPDSPKAADFKSRSGRLEKNK